MKKLSFVLPAALALALCAAPSAQAGVCHNPGDPVFDPGSNCKVDFSISPAMTGASALVKGYRQNGTVYVEAPSYLKDSADDGLAAHLWLRYSYVDIPGSDHQGSIANVSGNGATKDVEWVESSIQSLQARVCLGEGTAQCSPWRG
ncbi:hypothetical protein ACIA8G_09810 [Lentzea sp. NPDC051213]|uniref:hypothetical protein n=1 Tax=Lentzea sp. NPDC051213 TaxID=3364126 RepID=UPI0037A83269